MLYPREKAMVQFVVNLKRVKKMVVKWAYHMRIKDERDLADTESSLKDMYQSKGGTSYLWIERKPYYPWKIKKGNSCKKKKKHGAKRARQFG
jgi:hypothetical protein